MRDNTDMNRRRFEDSRTHERALAALEGRDSFDNRSPGVPPKASATAGLQSNSASSENPSGVRGRGGGTAHQVRNEDSGRPSTRSLPVNAARRRGSGGRDRGSGVSTAVAAAAGVSPVGMVGGEKGPVLDMKSLQELESALSDESKVWVFCFILTQSNELCVTIDCVV